ncbi:MULTISPECIES: PLP-dependent aminotransferase family protein [unclassified Mesorhizobium]|uniref:MocR-like pyridoxine biosynthesis transcription factor PdxR n=1 Tax=unclassified Mesorhizobium TaxID=325217 RepID=UPI00112AF602|nr:MULTISPECIES: PLP-dependent aminotransferase family protein [unclassified Mesorhizobium]TPK60743.1 PLP-dependent aminotransferase family protein [Mesorhizobium sp. B2-5-1]TPM56811.1 PLP-dependent aminotransferase family protein [Mesorhizobium sp. B2-1-9]TPM84626.1 PLP-dependent aminotransferase family protein [Mesorhizobium sp. B2-1-4]TPN07822.1 PLP-dependent aminotransferase family protein [Mesorhizobium sp. B2-1-2]UCI12831.1 PLP-dependent aminotransferase family protein [Mesorhizobium sp.
MSKPLDLDLDRAAKTSLAEQIRKGVAVAIEEGALESGARLPSWQDLAAQLGVARGTVRTAYEKLAAAQLIEATPAEGTRVAQRPRTVAKSEPVPDEGSFMRIYQEMTQGPRIFQMGIPASDIFPATLFARIRAHAIRAEAAAAALYPDPRGELELRREIAGYLPVARGIICLPSQVIITGGFGAGLGLALSVLKLAGETAWIEEPSFPWTRKGLELAGLSLAPVPVDCNGIDLDDALCQHPTAKLALVTPGQHAPLGSTLSLERRLRLLEWAASTQAWVIEDDYLSELQLTGRAAPALASLDRDGRVIHIGSFSKTISPTLRLGFAIVPASLVCAFAEVAACLAPAPGPAVQLATAEFMREGHYIRHLRRTKRAYVARRATLLEQLWANVNADQIATPGLAVLLKLPREISDITVAREVSAFGMSPAPLSAWYASPATAESGLLLGVATTPGKNLAKSCDRLFEAIRQIDGGQPI